MSTATLINCDIFRILMVSRLLKWPGKKGPYSLFMMTKIDLPVGGNLFPSLRIRHLVGRQTGVTSIDQDVSVT